MAQRLPRTESGLEQAAIDASVSWFFGYHKLPGILNSGANGGVALFIQAHRTHVLGADFSTVVGRYGFRGELALSLPAQPRGFHWTVPCQQMELTLGVDRQWGNLNLIV